MLALGNRHVMVLGSVCTRNCGFCAIDTGRPPETDTDEPRRVGEAAAQMRLNHAVITMVARDDLPDGGASIVADTIRAIRRESPGTSVEVLISDLNGREADIRTVVEAQPDSDHNVGRCRGCSPRSDGGRVGSVRLGSHHRPINRHEIGHDAMVTKTGYVGMGEARELVDAMRMRARRRSR